MTPPDGLRRPRLVRPAALDDAPPARSEAEPCRELRGPLHVIVGSAELLLDGPLDDAQRAHVEAIAAAAAVLRDRLEGARAGARPPPVGRLHGRVLVVDDEAVNARLAAAMLARLGLEVTTAEGGVAGLAALERRTFDVVLTDVQMPDLDGIELTKRLRHLDLARRRHTAVVALTAEASPEDRRRCLDAGMDDHLAKPADRATLAATVARWLPAGADETTANRSGTMRRDERLGRRPGAVLSGPALEDLRRLADEVGPDALREVLELYRSDVPDRVRQLRDHLAAGDVRALRRSAHGFRGSSASVGAQALSALCDHLERSEDDDERARLVVDIQREAAAVLGAIEAELAALPEARVGVS